MINEVKLFSELMADPTANYREAIRSGSMSDTDAEQRLKVYSEVFDNYQTLRKGIKTFSSYADNDLQSSQYFNATVTGLAKSFAGFLSIERSIDAPTALLYFLDLLNVTTGQTVMPNIGAENIGGYDNKVEQLDVALTVNSNAIALNKRLIPGSVKFVITLGGTDYTVVDDKNGGLLAPPNTLDVGTINYETGAIQLDIDASVTLVGGDQYTLVAVEDQVATQNINRFKTELKHVEVKTYPELLIGETDLVSIAAMQKTLGIDPQDVIISKLTELYTKMINREMVNAIKNADTSTAVSIDVSGTGFDDYRSRIDAFSGGLTDVDGELGERSVKGVKATCYIAGKNVVKWFRKTKQIGLFTEAASSYVNDLVGYYDGIPVLEHLDLDANEAFACHKTLDGNLAPVGRGIYLPLTSTPTIGNYANPTQMATGVFYQEENVSIAPLLSHRFTITI